jgi:hypothetical protein
MEARLSHPREHLHRILSARRAAVRTARDCRFSAWLACRRVASQENQAHRRGTENRQLLFFFTYSSSHSVGSKFLSHCDCFVSETICLVNSLTCFVCLFLFCFVFSRRDAKSAENTDDDDNKYCDILVCVLAKFLFISV